MRPSPSIRGGRRLGRLASFVPRERGASAVEFALVAPLLIMLTLGIMEVGMLLYGASAAQSSASNAARLGASQSRVPGYQTQIADALAASLVKSSAEPVALSVFRADPTSGNPVSGQAPATCSTQCYRFTWDASSKAFVPTTGPAWDASEQQACGTVDATDYLGVWIQTRQTSITGVIPTRQYSTSAVARLEPISTSSGSSCAP